MSDSTPSFGPMPEELYATYRDERNRLTESEQAYGKSYDKYLVTLAGGAIALSLAFLKDIVGDHPITGSVYLISAWVLLGLTIGMNVAGLYVTPITFAHYRDVMDRQAELGGKRYWTRVREEQAKLQLPRVIRWLNILSLLTFLFGLFLLLGFTYGSINAKGFDMSTKSDSSDRQQVTNREPARGPVDRLGAVPTRECRGGSPPPLAPVDRVPTPAPPSQPQSTQPSNGQSTPQPSKSKN